MPHGITVREQYNNYHLHSFYFVTINLGKSFLGIDSRKARREMNKKKEFFGIISDPDLKRELASGQTQLISYTES